MGRIGSERRLRRAGVLLAALFVLPGIAGSVARAQEPEPLPEGRLLVLSKAENSLLVLEVPSYKRLAVIPVGSEPHEVVATPDGRKAYVSNVRDKTLSVVDLDSLKVARTVRSDRLDSPHGLAVTPDGRHLLVTSEGSHRFFLIDVARDVVLRSITTNQARDHMVVILDGGRKAFAANVDSDTVTLLKLPELRILRHIPVGDGPEGIDVTSNGKWVLVALQRTDQVAILDAGSGAVLARLPTGRTPIRIAVTPNSFTALVTNRASNDVTVLDVLARRVKKTVGVGGRPGGVTTNATGSRAYVCNGDSNTVSVISLPGFEVTDTLPVGAQPDGIAFVPRHEPSGRKRSKSS